MARFGRSGTPRTERVAAHHSCVYQDGSVFVAVVRHAQEVVAVRFKIGTTLRVIGAGDAGYLRRRGGVGHVEGDHLPLVVDSVGVAALDIDFVEVVDAADCADALQVPRVRDVVDFEVRIGVSATVAVEGGNVCVLSLDGDGVAAVVAASVDFINDSWVFWVRDIRGVEDVFCATGHAEQVPAADTDVVAAVRGRPRGHDFHGIHGVRYVDRVDS